MSRKLSERECYVCEVCDGSWQGVNEQNGELKCYHCSEEPKHLYAVKIMKADLDSYVTEMAQLKELMLDGANVLALVNQIHYGGTSPVITPIEIKLREAAK